MEYTAEGRSKGDLIFRDTESCVSDWSPDPQRGWTEIHLSPATSSVLGFTLGRQIMEEGDAFGLHHHKHSDEVFHIIEGTGVAEIDGVPHPLYPGLTIFNGRNRAHTVRNTGKGRLIFLFLCLPPGVEHVLESIGAKRQPGEARPEAVPFRDPQTYGAIGVLARFCSSPGPAE